MLDKTLNTFAIIADWCGQKIMSYDAHAFASCFRAMANSRKGSINVKFLSMFFAIGLLAICDVMIQNGFIGMFMR